MSGRRDRHAVSPSRPVIALAVLFVLVVVLVGGRRLGAGLRGVAAVWRPTTGLLSVVVMMAAAVLAIREDWWIAVLLAVLAGALALAARKRKALTPATDAMSPAEARAILGVPEGAGGEAIDAAYRRLIRFAHPDQGGTVGLASQLNAARATLRRG